MPTNNTAVKYNLQQVQCDIHEQPPMAITEHPQSNYIHSQYVHVPRNGTRETTSVEMMHVSDSNLLQSHIQQQHTMYIQPHSEPIYNTHLPETNCATRFPPDTIECYQSLPQTAQLLRETHDILLSPGDINYDVNYPPLLHRQ